MKERKAVVKHTYFSNWADLFAYPLAYRLLPFVTNVPFLTPNVITLLAFSSYTLGSLSLFLTYPYHLIIAGILIPLGFLGDDLDGQVARARSLSSNIGDFLDKVLDVLKIFIITSSLSYAVYLQRQNVLWIYLGFIACFFFLWRYYIKLETMFAQINKNQDYLAKSAKKKVELEQQIDDLYSKEHKSFSEKLYVLWHKNRTFFFLDEAEFAIVTGIAALFNQLPWALVLLATGQVIIAVWHFFERGNQVRTQSDKLLLPMRK